MWSGCWAPRGGMRAVRRDRDRSGNRAHVRAQSWRSEFGARVAFADLAAASRSLDGDRTEFLGRNGTLDRPAALAQGDDRFPAGSAPASIRAARCRPRSNSRCGYGDRDRLLCSARPTTGRGRRAGRQIPRRRSRCRVRRGHEAVWDEILGAVQVRTPDRAMDLLLNRWLLYQTLACRIWARSAFYQASGAYGFRDQLQDVMALCVARPDDRARAHLCARRRGSSSKATCSTGGCRRPARASARASPTTASGCLRRRALRRGDRRRARPRRDGAVPRGPSAAGRASTTRSSSRRCPTRRPRCSNIARARSTQPRASARTACR